MQTALPTGFLLACVCTNVWAGFAEGMAAYERGDCSLAYREFSDAASHGDSDALINMSTLGEVCCGKPSSGGNSEKLICKAAEADNASAKFLVLYGRFWGGSMCGQAAIKHSEEAQELTQLTRLALASAGQGFPFAMGISGQYYERGAKPDMVRAYAWYGLAAKRGLDRRDSDRIAAKLSAEELSQAKDLVEQLDKSTPRRIIGAPPSCSPGTS